MRATLIAGALVVVFMAIYYRLSGVIADFALMLNLVCLIGAFAALNATLTLPGIAGIILTIGMGVDSNVLIFERIREELRQGKPVRLAVDSGYDKALLTIVDSHVTTLITGFALFLFGTGPIKGFAVTLCLGIAINLFTALVGTKVIFDRDQSATESGATEYLTKEPACSRFWGRRISISWASGGSRLRFPASWCCWASLRSCKSRVGPPTWESILPGARRFNSSSKSRSRSMKPERALESNGLAHAELQEFSQENKLLMRVKAATTIEEKTAEQVMAVFRKEFPENKFVVESSTEIGPTIGKKLQSDALIAILISFAGIIIYIAARFEFRFGVAAALATFHDVLAVLGAFYILDKEITLLVVTALLTLAGYSLTDTVVVFDRIRENLRMRRREPEGDHHECRHQPGP